MDIDIGRCRYLAAYYDEAHSNICLARNPSRRVLTGAQVGQNPGGIFASQVEGGSSDMV